MLQARPITALPPPVEWQAPLPGAWTRNFRLGEWLPDPLTPLFESWLLERLESRLSFYHRTEGGVPIPPPVHLVINGWYYFSVNFFPDQPVKMAGLMLRRMLPVFARHPWRLFLQVAMLQTSRFGVEPFVKDWRDKHWPRYQQLVQTGETSLDRLDPAGLMRLVDQLGDAAGDYFWSLVIVGGFAWKAERPLAEFYRSQLYPHLGQSYQYLLGGLYPPRQKSQTGRSSAWIGSSQPPVNTTRTYQHLTGLSGPRRHETLKAQREDLEKQARTYLAGKPALLKRFNRLWK